DERTDRVTRTEVTGEHRRRLPRRELLKPPDRAIPVLVTETANALVDRVRDREVASHPALPLTRVVREAARGEIAAAVAECPAVEPAGDDRVPDSFAEQRRALTGRVTDDDETGRDERCRGRRQHWHQPAVHLDRADRRARCDVVRERVLEGFEKDARLGIA